MRQFLWARLPGPFFTRKGKNIGDQRGSDVARDVAQIDRGSNVGQWSVDPRVGPKYDASFIT